MHITEPDLFQQRPHQAPTTEAAAETNGAGESIVRVEAVPLRVVEHLRISTARHGQSYSRCGIVGS